MTAPLAPSDPVRAVRAMSRVTALVLTFLAVYGLVAGGAAAPALYWGGLLGGLGLLLLARWNELQFADRQPWWTLYVLMVLALVLISWFAVDASPGPVDLWVPLWALQAVAAAYSLPRRGQVIAYVLGGGSLTAVLVLRGVSPAVIVLDVGLYLVLALVTARLSERLGEALERQREARIEAEERHGLLVALARMNQLDVARIAEETVEALATLGYEMSTFGLVDEDRHLLHPIAAVGYDDDSFVDQPVNIGDGLAGQAVAERRTVFVEDYRTWPRRLEGREEIRGGVAAPIVLEGEVRGVLQGARRTPGSPDPSAIEVIEVLAAQAARLLRNAEVFQRERETVERFRELDRLKGDFIASVSHELRTPLTVLQGAGQTLAERTGDLTPEQRTMLVERLNANADRLDRMISALLQMSNFESGGVAVQQEAVGLGSLVARVSAAIDEFRDGHHIESDVGEAAVQADPSLLELVLSSLVGNAVKHTPRGTSVHVRARTRDGIVEIDVSDDGPGIDPHERPYILDQFFRGGPPTRRSSSGLGLGLTVADRILVHHGSRLEVLEGSSGAHFRFRLPVAEGGS